MENSQISPQQAAQELLRRRAARKNLLAFTEYTNHQYIAADHHRQICEKLEAVERGEIDRLMIFMPPRHGKSELASKRFPAWYIGRNPDKQIITASYGADLATDFGREVRNIVSSLEYQNLFETRLKDDSKAANRWNTQQGGVYIATGVGGSVIGRGAHVALIDDPVKDRADADSETIRDKIYNWYRGTLYHRLMPGGAIVLIQTRWHEDDLAGRLLEMQEKGEGDNWEILDLPAINEDGEALWPEWFDKDRLERIKVAMGPRDWQALFQQNPTPDDGTYFKREWFNWYTENPDNMTTYMAGDFAVTEGDGDFTEIGVACTDKDDNLYIAPAYEGNPGWFSGQTTTDVWIDALIDMAKVHNPDAFISEKGVIRNAIEPFLEKRCHERRVYFLTEWLAHIGDKAANARAFQGRASQGKVFLPDNDVGHRILNQLLAFPAGKHDDIVDVCGLLGRYLQDMNARQPAPTPKPAETDAWGRPRQMGNDWKTL